jgi:hypothetical protein
MRVLSITAALLLAATASAAPAPFPRSGGKDAEVVFDARTPERARLASIYLRSQYILPMLRTTTEGSRQLTELRTQQQQKAWLRERLTIETQGGQVRVRFRGEGAVAFLTEVARALTRETFEDERRLRARRRDVREFAAEIEAMRHSGGFSKEELLRVEEHLAVYEFGAEPLKLRSQPQQVRRGR